jgi:hypothetical protein
LCASCSPRQPEAWSSSKQQRGLLDELLECFCEGGLGRRGCVCVCV